MILELLLLAIVGGAPAGSPNAETPPMAVPRGGAIVVDGVLDEAEWRGAALMESPDGIAVRLRHDGSGLDLGIRSQRSGFASVCLAQEDSIEILHASAALGEIRYLRSGAEWAAEATEFEYGMRRTDLGEEARAERGAYLAAHGWVASTFRMGGGLTQEIHLSQARVAGLTGLAVAFFVPEGDGGSVLRWPEELAVGDGCADPQLVRGFVPAKLRFDPARWLGVVPAR